MKVKKPAKRVKKEPSVSELKQSQEAVEDYWPQQGTFWIEAESGLKVEVLGVGVSVHTTEWLITYRRFSPSGNNQLVWTRTLRSWYGKVKGKPAYEPAPF